MKNLLFLLIGITICGCSYFNHMLGMEDDNIVEEVAEEVIELKAGINIDLTPDSPEK